CRAASLVPTPAAGRLVQLPQLAYRLATRRLYRVLCLMPDQESSHARSTQSARSYEGIEHPENPIAARRRRPRWSITRSSRQLGPRFSSPSSQSHVAGDDCPIKPGSRAEAGMVTNRQSSADRTVPPSTPFGTQARPSIRTVRARDYPIRASTWRLSALVNLIHLRQ